MSDMPLPFIDYSPPGGGLHRLQCSLLAQRSARERRTARLVPRLTGAALITLGLGMLCLLPGWWARQQSERHLVDVVQRAVTEQSKPIVVTNGVAIALPSGQSNVRLYLVQSLPRPPSTPRSAP